MKQIFSEARRRNLFRVAAVYIVTAWLIVQVVGVVSPGLSLPAWTLPFFIILLVIGFPLALIFAWAFELTPQGIRPTHKVHPGESIRHLTGRKLDYTIIAVLVLIAAVLYMRQDYLARELQQTQQTLAELRGQGSPGSANELAIAVLPFNNMSEDPANEYFSDGVSEEILNSLARIPDLKVVGRTSSFIYKDDHPDLVQIGKELNVPYILEGSVRKSNNQVRITAQLIDSSNGFHLWSETYDAELDNIFAVQDEISLAIVDALKLEILPEDITAFGRLSTSNAMAYDIYLKARDRVRNANSADDFTEAIDLYDQALKRDPTFVEAESGKCHALERLYGDTRDREILDTAISSCNRAITVNPEVPELRVALGNLYARTGRFEYALQSFEHAIKLDPENDDAYRGLGEAYAKLGNWEQAEINFNRAIALTPNYALNYAVYGKALMSAQRMEDAAAMFRKAAELQPDNPRHYSNLGAMLWMLGQFQEAGHALMESNRISPNARAYSNAGTSFYYSGDFDAALQAYRSAVEMLPNHYMVRWNLADACQRVSSCTASTDYYRDALEMVDEHLMVNPDDAEALTAKAIIEGRLGRMSQARELQQRALQLDSKNVQVLRNAAVVAAIAGDTEQARRYAEQAVEGGFPVVAMLADPDIPYREKQ